jgi:cell division septation protein DedD
MDAVNVRNLEQIQETDVRKRSSRLPALLLASMGGAALVVVAVMMAKDQGEATQPQEDPLEDLVAKATQVGTAPEKLDERDVTFPEILSDGETPTTALAAVKDEKGRLVQRPEDAASAADQEAHPPVAGDSLPVVPLPAGSLLNATPVTTEPKDQLTSLAATASEMDDDAEMAAPGSDSGYQIQVASFKKASDADAFVADLRKRGHRAFRQAAYVPDRGLWHRVRIGPFKTKYQALLYKKKFEKSERVSPFVVDPDRVKHAAEIRAAKLAIRKKKYGRE